MRAIAREAQRCRDLASRFPGYEPRPISWLTVRRYIRQFNKNDREAVYAMLKNVRYISREDSELELLRGIQGILQQADRAGVPRDHVFILPASSKGESSTEMVGVLAKLNAVNDLGITIFAGTQLELRSQLLRCKGAVVVFVDDFVGSGKQFRGSYTAWQSVVSFPQVTSILMTIVMCHEATATIRALGVEPRYAILHEQGHRFQTACKLDIGDELFEQLSSYAREIHSKFPFGFEDMGCMTVIYRNSNNNMPFLLRGSRGQRVWFGLFPRRDQLSPA